MSRHVKLLCFLLIFTSCFIGGCKFTDNSAKSTEGKEQLQQNSILVYSGAGLRKPMEELGKMYQEKTGTSVEFSYGGSAQCVTKILTINKGDIFLPGDVAELKPLLEKDKITAQKPVVLHIPVLAVPKGNPAGITGLQDLTKPGLKVVLGDVKANPIGKLADRVLKDAGIFEQVEKNVVARAATVNELFTYLAMRQADVSIIWEDNLVGNDKLELVQTDGLAKHIKTVPIVSLKCSQNPEAAAQFLNFVSSKEAQAVWAKWGFKPAPESPAPTR